MSVTRRMTCPSPHRWVCVRSHGARARDCLSSGSRPKEDVDVAVAEAAGAAAMLSALTPIFLALTSARATPIARGSFGPHGHARPALAPPAGAPGLSDGWQLVS